MYREVEEVAETVNMMIENGVVGEAIVETGEYSIKIKLMKRQKEKLYRDANWLYNEYKVYGRTMQDIGDEFGISAAAINQWLVKHDIDTRERGHKRV